MMSDCHRIEDLAAIGALAAGDPRRRHLDSCARCRARLATYLEFVDAAPAVIGSRREEALARLGAALDREILGTAAGDASPATERRPARRAAAGRRRRDWRALIEDLWRPAGALAAAALIVAVGITLVGRSHDPGGIVLRSGDEGGRHAPLALAPPRVRPDGALVLGWSRVPGADAYRVEILGAELDLVATLATGPDTVLAIGPRELGRMVADPGVYAVTVTALAGDDALERSAPAPLVIGPGELSPPR